MLYLTQNASGHSPVTVLGGAAVVVGSEGASVVVAASPSVVVVAVSPPQAAATRAKTVRRDAHRATRFVRRARTIFSSLVAYFGFGAGKPLTRVAPKRTLGAAVPGIYPGGRER
jgi:hypothetical protein